MYRYRHSLFYRLAMSTRSSIFNADNGRLEEKAETHPTLNIGVSKCPRFISVLSSKVDPSRFLVSDMDPPLNRVAVLAVDFSKYLTILSKSIESEENALSI